MKRTIRNPNTVNHLLYASLIILFSITLSISTTLPKGVDGERTFLAEVILNLSYGCIASTVVAWLIDCANTRNANRQANRFYDAVYSDLKVSMGWFLDTWARLCRVCFDDEDYSTTFHTWYEWYKIAKDHYRNTEAEKQEELMQFFRDEISHASLHVMTSLETIRSQTNLLILNQVMDANINNILADYHFEFKALSRCLSQEENEDYFWSHMDAIAEDFIRYINNWPDIQHYNKQEFRPFNFFEKIIIDNTEA